MRHRQVDLFQTRTKRKSVGTERLHRRRQHDCIQQTHVLTKICRNGLHLVAERELRHLRTRAVERSSIARTDRACHRLPSNLGKRTTTKGITTDRVHRTRYSNRREVTIIERALVNGRQTFRQVHTTEFGTAVESVLVDGRDRTRQGHGLQVLQCLKSRSSYRDYRIGIGVIGHGSRNRHRGISRINRLVGCLILDHGSRGRSQRIVQTVYQHGLSRESGQRAHEQRQTESKFFHKYIVFSERVSFSYAIRRRRKL